MKKFLTENKIMLLTVLIGTIISVIYAMIIDFGYGDEFGMSFLPLAYYPLIGLIISIGARNRIKDPVWEATIITSPCYLGIFAFSLIQSAFLVCFSIVLSLVILEYRIIKRRR